MKQTYNVVDGRSFCYFISRLIKDKETSRTLSKFIECAGIFTLQNWLTVCIRQLSNIEYRVTLLSKCLRTVAINHHLYRISSNSQQGQCFILLFLHHTVYIKHKQRHNTGYRYIQPTTVKPFYCSHHRGIKIDPLLEWVIFLSMFIVYAGEFINDRYQKCNLFTMKWIYYEIIKTESNLSFERVKLKNI